MAIIHSNDKGKDLRYYVWGDDSNADCPTNHRALWARSNEWIENNQGSSAAFQGASSFDRRFGDIGFRRNYLVGTKPEVVIQNERAEDGDSGGPIFDIEYNSKYDEVVAYILGVTAERDESDTWGQTYQAFKNHFNVIIQYNDRNYWFSHSQATQNRVDGGHARRRRDHDSPGPSRPARGVQGD